MSSLLDIGKFVIAVAVLYIVLGMVFGFLSAIVLPFATEAELRGAVAITQPLSAIGAIYGGYRVVY